ncbi:MAG TPA: hypothetical protein VFA32_09310, partial [Dehalococcoidia bacterium]|nr:hypothetical protein [Dehalococcoidia bacterium]
AVEDPPDDMYGKLMSLPDTLIVPYFEYLTDTPEEELAEMSHQLEDDSVNPMELKKRLAREITATFYDPHTADAAQENFERVVQRRDLPEDVPQVHLGSLVTDTGEPIFGPTTSTPSVRWSSILKSVSLASSTSDAKRVIDQGGIELIYPSGDSITLHQDTLASELVDNLVIKRGNRRYVRLTDKQLAEDS